MSPPTPDRPEDWFDLDDAARQCKRSAKTMRNLISAHQLPRRLLWRVRHRKRFRVIYLSPATVAYLQRITLYGDSPAVLQKPGA